MRPSILMEATARGLFHVTLMISVWATFRGHNSPGGGFIGGLIAASAFVMLYLARGAVALRRSVRLAPSTLMGLGLVLAVVTGLVPVVLGEQFMESDLAPFTLPIIGDTKLATSVIFDLHVITELGAELGRELLQRVLGLGYTRHSGDETEDETPAIPSDADRPERTSDSSGEVSP
jgi:multicomponent Na+:H+ antiporter subunit A